MQDSSKPDTERDNYGETDRIKSFVKLATGALERQLEQRREQQEYDTEMTNTLIRELIAISRQLGSSSRKRQSSGGQEDEETENLDHHRFTDSQDATARNDGKKEQRIDPGMHQEQLVERIKNEQRQRQHKDQQPHPRPRQPHLPRSIGREYERLKVNQVGQTIIVDEIHSTGSIEQSSIEEPFSEYDNAQITSDHSTSSDELSQKLALKSQRQRMANIMNSSLQHSRPSQNRCPNLKKYPASVGYQSDSESSASSFSPPQTTQSQDDSMVRREFERVLDHFKHHVGFLLIVLHELKSIKTEHQRLQMLKSIESITRSTGQIDENHSENGTTLAHGRYLLSKDAKYSSRCGGEFIMSSLTTENITSSSFNSSLNEFAEDHFPVIEVESGVLSPIRTCTQIGFINDGDFAHEHSSTSENTLNLANDMAVHMLSNKRAQMTQEQADQELERVLFDFDTELIGSSSKSHDDDSQSLSDVDYMHLLETHGEIDPDESMRIAEEVIEEGKKALLSSRNKHMNTSTATENKLSPSTMADSPNRGTASSVHQQIQTSDGTWLIGTLNGDTKRIQPTSTPLQLTGGSSFRKMIEAKQKTIQQQLKLEEQALQEMFQKSLSPNQNMGELDFNTAGDPVKHLSQSLSEHSNTHRRPLRISDDMIKSASDDLSAIMAKYVHLKDQ